MPIMPYYFVPFHSNTHHGVNRIHLLGCLRAPGIPLPASQLLLQMFLLQQPVIIVNFCDGNNEPGFASFHYLHATTY